MMETDRTYDSTSSGDINNDNSGRDDSDSNHCDYDCVEDADPLTSDFDESTESYHSSEGESDHDSDEGQYSAGTRLDMTLY